MRGDGGGTGAARRLWTCLCVLAAGGLLAACNSPQDAGHRIYGYVDTQGRAVIAPAFLDALPFHDGLAAVRVASGWGYIDAHGRWVIQPVYLEAGTFWNDRAAVRDVNGLWGYIDRSGRLAIAPQSMAASQFIGDRAFVADDAGRTRVIDRDGRVVAVTSIAGVPVSDVSAEATFASYLDVSNALQAADMADASRAARLIAVQFKDQGLSGYVDPDGRTVIEPEFEEAHVFVGERALVRKDGKYGFIDRQGRVVVPLRYDEALLRFSRERTIVVHDGRAWLIDAEGHDVADLGEWPWLQLGKEEEFGDLARFVGHGDFFADGRVPWQRDGKWGYVGLDGRWAIEPQYQLALPFQDGHASVRVNGRGLLIDVQGRQLASAPPGAWIAPAGGALAWGGTATAWGFVGADGKLPKVLPYATTRITFAQQSFADASPLRFSEGLAIVSRMAPHRWQIVDLDGRARAAGRFDWIEGAGEGLYAVAIGQRWALANDELKTLSAVLFDNQPVFNVPSDHGAWVARDGTTGCVNRSGEWRPLQVALRYADCEGPLMIAARATDGKFGVLGADGHWVIAPAYLDVDRLGGSGATCFQLTFAEDVEGTFGRIACIQGRKVRYSEVRQLVCATDRLCFLRTAAGWRRLDMAALQYIGPAYDEVAETHYGYAMVRTGSHWGLVTTDGRVILPTDYDQIEMRQGDDAGGHVDAMVRKGELWGVGTLDGPRDIPVRFDRIADLAGGLYAAQTGTDWGVIRGDEQEVVAPQFESILALRGQLLLVRSGGTLHLRTLDGRQVLEPSPPWLQRIHQLADFSDGFWAAFTLDRELYFISKSTLAVHRLDPPAGYLWLSPAYVPRLPDKIAGFKDQPFARRMHALSTVMPQDPERMPLHSVLIDPEGRMVPGVFDEDDVLFDLPGKHSIVRLRGKCGVADERGHFTVPLTHDHCEAINGGFVVLGDEDY